jgi:MFS family permease
MKAPPLLWTWPPVALTLLFAATLTVMSGATISPALPKIAEAFAGHPNADIMVKLVLTVPALFIVIGGPIAGWIVDTIGRRKLLLTGLTLYALAGTAGAFATSLEGLIVTRAFLGLAVASVMTCATTMLIDNFEGPARLKLMGLQAAFASGGGVVFILLGGILSELGWRAPFFIYLASLIILAFAVPFLPEPKRPPIQEAMGKPKQNMRIAWAIYGGAFISQVAFYTIPVNLPFVLAQDYGVAGAAAGAAIAVSTLAMALISSNYPRVRARLPYRDLIAIAFGLMGTGFVVIGLAHSLPALLFGLAITGLAIGVLMPSCASWLSEIADPAFRGRVMGGLGTAVFLGQFSSPILTGPLSQAMDYHWVYGALGAALLAAALASRPVLNRAAA